jgi:hypothetical protein
MLILDVRFDRLNPLLPSDCIVRFVTFQFYFMFTRCVYVFCVDLRTNNDYFPIQHYMAGFYILDEVRLLRVRINIYI